MDDLINRKAAIDALGGEPLPYTEYEQGLHDKWIDAKENIEALPSAQQWIPCSERLPNHDEYIKNNGLFIVSDGNRSYSEWYDIYGKRKFGEPTISGFRVDYAVTHWMSLPTPSRGEQNE